MKVTVFDGPDGKQAVGCTSRKDGIEEFFYEHDDALFGKKVQELEVGVYDARGKLISSSQG